MRVSTSDEHRIAPAEPRWVKTLRKAARSRHPYLRHLATVKLAEWERKR